MDRADKKFKYNLINQILIVVVMLLLLYSAYVILEDMVHDDETIIVYNVIGSNIITSKNNVSATFMFEGNYTVLFEYTNISNNEAVDKYFIQYELQSITTNSTYVFDVTRDYDEIFLILRNDDLKFSEGHKIN